MKNLFLMNTNKKIVYFFIDNYSISFVKSEIQNLSNAFDKVIVITTKNYGVIELKNVEIQIISFSNYSSSNVFFSNLFVFTKLILSELFSNLTYFKYPSIIKNISSDLLQTLYLKDIVREKIANLNYQPVFYSFWFNKWATLLSILSKENIIDHYISRTHGTDLFEERVPYTGKIPFREFQLKYVSRVFSVSKIGENYLKNKYAIYQDKIHTSYLGTKFYGINTIKNNEVFTIVSCARVRNIKRIHLLADLIKQVDFPIKWIHIGSENLKSTDITVDLYLKCKEEIKLKNNIEFIATGDLTNEEVLKMYATIPINLFVSVSETEGLPVSMMEAISFGIPIFSSNVGGCQEIVTHETGMLIEKDFEKYKFIEMLSKFKSSNMNSEQFREGVMNFWKKKFDNSINFGTFLKCNKLN